MIYDKETLMIIQNAILVMKHYDNGEDVALTTSRNRLLDLEQKLLQHGVSGKRPDLKHILIAYGCKHIGLNQAYEEILAACASGAVDKTVRDGKKPDLTTNFDSQVFTNKITFDVD